MIRETQKNTISQRDMDAAVLNRYGEKAGKIILESDRKYRLAAGQTVQPACVPWIPDIIHAGVCIDDLEEARQYIREKCQDPERLPAVLKAVDLNWDACHCREARQAMKIRTDYELAHFRETGSVWDEDDDD